MIGDRFTKPKIHTEVIKGELDRLDIEFNFTKSEIESMMDDPIIRDIMKKSNKSISL